MPLRSPKTRKRELGPVRCSSREEGKAVLFFEYHKLAEKSPMCRFMVFVVRGSTSDLRAVACAKDPTAGVWVCKVQIQKGKSLLVVLHTLKWREKRRYTVLWFCRAPSPRVIRVPLGSPRTQKRELGVPKRSSRAERDCPLFQIPQNDGKNPRYTVLRMIRSRLRK